ncbi:MAG TPA: hypothetical protein VN282_05020 [Pyrinomonadaceae bacterium]|nr:hypothetical protein [Pyrinomonadaceae bacterium]
MTRVGETVKAVTVAAKGTRPTSDNAAGAPAEVSRTPRKPSRRRIISKVLSAAVLLTCLFGGSQSVRAEQPPPTPTTPDTTGTPKPTPTPPTITGVVPEVAQPESVVTISFSQKVAVSSVKIANTDAPLVSVSADVEKVEVKVAQNVPAGKQGVAVTLASADGTSATLNTFMKVAPVITGLKSDEKTVASRGVVAGGEAVVQFGDNIPPEIRDDITVKIGDTPAEVVSRQNNYLVVRVPENLEAKPEGAYPVHLSVGKTPLPWRQPTLWVVQESKMYWRSSLFLLGLIALVYVLYKLRFRRRAPALAGQKRYNFAEVLLLEQENMTYSLSRAQFLVWLLAIIWAYLFLYFGHGFVKNDWGFPSLGNTVYTFLISLGTLVASSAATAGQGAKGAGEVHPSLSDLVVHGGVLALDRVQQVVWTALAVGMFLVITVRTYDTATALPDIPQEMLVLMGLSSAGYLGGKLVRGAGPIVEQVSVREGSVVLNIKGKHLSKDGFVWIDGVKQPKDNISVIADDIDSPLQFAKEIEVKLDITLADWRAKDHAITFVNADAQRADWRTGPEIVEVTAGEPDDKGKVTLTITGARVSRGATLELAGAAGVKPEQDQNDPNVFTAQVDKAWTSEPHVLTLTSGGQKSLFTYKPASQPEGEQPGGVGEQQPGGEGGGQQQSGGGETIDSANSMAGEQAGEGGVTGEGDQGDGNEQFAQDDASIADDVSVENDESVGGGQQSGTP